MEERLASRGWRRRRACRGLPLRGCRVKVGEVPADPFAVSDSRDFATQDLVTMPSRYPPQVSDELPIDVSPCVVEHVIARSHAQDLEARQQSGGRPVVCTVHRPEQDLRPLGSSKPSSPGWFRQSVVGDRERAGSRIIVLMLHQSRDLALARIPSST
jgi:hypothetical protein